MNDFQKFIPFCKVDEAKREVYGIITAEVEDKVGETCHYESTKKEYKAWAAEFTKATDGKSCGNLRYMHTPRAIGKGIEIEFRDAEKEIFMGFKVTDDDAWKDVQEGVLTGFSQGGGMSKVWKDGKKTYFTAVPAEVSLVDNPCLGVSHFAYVKADGAVEMRKARTAELPTEGFTPSGPVTIDMGAVIRKAVEEAIAAVQALPPVEKTATTVPEVLPPAKDFTPEIEKATASLNAALPLVQKGMYELAQFACLLDELGWMQTLAEWEAAIEEDESPVPSALLAQLKELCQVFLAMAEEEVGELVTPQAEKATYAQVRKASALLPKAAEILKTKAGSPAERVPPMSDLQTQKAGLIELFTKFLETNLPAEPTTTQKAAAPVAPVAPVPAAVAPVAAPAVEPQADLAKGMGDQFQTVLKGMQDEFKSFMDRLASTLEPPKAAANGAVALSKAQDGTAAPTAPAAVAAEPSFRPLQKSTDLTVSDEYRKAMLSAIGSGVQLGAE